MSTSSKSGRGRGMFVSTGAGAALLKDERHRFLEDEWPKVHATIARLGLSAAVAAERDPTWPPQTFP